METPNRGREDRPNHNDPDEVRHSAPGKIYQAQRKINIVQSGLGREQGQMPADEHIEHRLSQIELPDQDSHHPGYMNDATSADRDTGSGDDNWNENSSRTARHK